MKNKCTFIILIFAVTLLTACGGLKTEQKAQWQEAISQIELLKNTLTENVSETKAYYDSINDEVKERMNKINFSSFVINEEWNDVSMPEKAKEFSTSYDILQQRILELQRAIDNVPTIELIKEQQDEVIKQIEAEKLKAEEEEKKRLAEIKKQEEQKKAQQGVGTYTQETNETKNISLNQEADIRKKIYTRYAEMGAVITSAGTSESKIYKYKRKCDSCGFVPSNNYSGSSSLHTSFTCTKCKNLQRVKITQEMTLQ